MGGFAPIFDLQDGAVSPQERLRAQLLKIIQRRKSITPNKSDGFLTTGSNADSESESDGQSVGATTAQAGVQN